MCSAPISNLPGKLAQSSRSNSIRGVRRHGCGLEEYMVSHSFRFPGETDSYRSARNQLLQAEVDLRRRVEGVAALRRQLPLGGQIPEDYVFEEGSGDLNDAHAVRQVSLSEMFQPGKDTLAIYSF